jgi:hypothetical protein
MICVALAVRCTKLLMLVHVIIAKNKALLLQEEAIRARRWCLEVVCKVGSPLVGY